MKVASQPDNVSFNREHTYNSFDCCALQERRVLPVQRYQALEHTCRHENLSRRSIPEGLFIWDAPGAVESYRLERPFQSAQYPPLLRPRLL